jgi:hypothetical protein
MCCIVKEWSEFVNNIGSDTGIAISIHYRMSSEELRLSPVLTPSSESEGYTKYSVITVYDIIIDIYVISVKVIIAKGDVET